MRDMAILLIAYGEKPNVFFQRQLANYQAGKILLPAEGEGRNAVFAATKGWKVDAFDLSEEGKKKALQLAKKHNVSITYQVGEFTELTYPKENFDVIGLIYAHFPAESKSAYHQQLVRNLKKGGIIIFEAFSKNHTKFNSVNSGVGGPKDVGMLFSIEEIENDFKDFEILYLKEEIVKLEEGVFHIGEGSVIRFVGKKK